MELIKQKLVKKAKYEINHNDMDWLHICGGGEGSGKSSFLIQLCKEVDPTFDETHIVFSVKGFMDFVKVSKKGQAVLIDEGALLVLRRDAMTQEVKRMIKLITVCRNYNLFIAIAIPKISLLDRYIIEHRVRSYTNIVMRGWYHAYNRRKIKQIVKVMKYPYKKIRKPKPIFREKFKNCKEVYPKLWTRYLFKKKRLLDRKAGKDTLDFGGIKITEYAKLVGKTRPTILEWINKKVIDAWQDPMGTWIIPSYEVDKLRNGLLKQK